jgi:hypothetical protein
MNRDSLAFARGVVRLAVWILLVIAAATLIDLIAAGYSPAKLAVVDYAGAHFLADLTNRGLNQVMALSFTVVAIAVPLTANLYSLKFLDFFVKDRINAAVLTLVVAADLVSLWAVYALKQDFIPFTLLYLSFGLLIVCLCVLFPYLLYVFRFLHPNTLLRRLENEICDALDTIGKPGAGLRQDRLAARRRLVAGGIEHIANIAVRSIERTDRATAIASMVTLERVAHAYWAVKSDLPTSWFQADPNSFQGFSTKAVTELTTHHTWVEMMLFWQLRCVMSAAAPRTHDVADTTARALRHLGLSAPARADPAVRELVIDYFNTFVRLALTRHDSHTAFALFDHYRQYAEALNADDPSLVLQIAFYFEYYGQVALESGQTFLVTAAAHDLGTLVQCAWETRAPNRQKLLERFLHYDSQNPLPLPGVKKAQAILASYFLRAGQAEPAELIRRSFVGLDPALVAEIQDDLLHIRREAYWEITERRAHIDYVPDAQREKLREFFDSLPLVVQGESASQEHQSV